MFGNGEAPPTATVSPVTKAVGPVLDRLWSRAPRGGGGLIPTRPVPASAYPRPTRQIGWPSARAVSDQIVKTAFGDWGYAGAAGALAFSFVLGFLFGRSTR